ncbi:DUF4440 domain-containing protein [Granulicella sibirica]|uniref:DUF4440 domain-containing protein n=1 Tax=Granulicella sibirica TaxID=2479048 RepID=A0A4Q0SXG5_9BACT|nr:DUF4440 domain-containing protein [Granulicella sibirica]RXH55833.1 hypothetical protein GRAN_2690 [Granulicella sibirica]
MNTLRALEEELFEPAVRRNITRLSEVLADGFREFGSSGRVFSKAQIMSELQHELERRISLSEFRVKAISKDAVLVTYRATRVQEGLADVHSLRSSIWMKREGRWEIVFHQGTVVP